MSTYNVHFAVNILAAVILLLLIGGMASKIHKPQSTKMLMMTIASCMLANVCDGLMYVPTAGWLKTIIMYGYWGLRQILLIFFIWYAYFYTKERSIAKVWPHYIPTAILIISLLVTIVMSAMGKLFTIENGITTFCATVPLSSVLMNMGCVVYMFIYGIIKRREVGVKSVVAIGIFGLLPIIARLYQTFFNGEDYTYLSGTIAMIVSYIFLDNKLAEEKEYEQKLQIRAAYKELEVQVREVEELNKVLSQQKEEVQAAYKAKSIFLFNMSHDIRTPMNAIMGYAELLKKKNNSPEVMEDYLNKIKNSGDYMLSLINNVLDMARIESGKMEVDEHFCDVLDPSSNAVVMFEELSKSKDIELTYDNCIQHRYVMMDIVKVHQILINIVSNAVKYTPNGGKITCHFDEVPCDKEGYVTFVTSVQDTGIGMTQEFKENIFDLFSRERNSTDSKVIGSGLGMSIVKKLVDMMGGTIDIETELGKGTKISVALTHKIVENPEMHIFPELIEEQEEVSFVGKRILLAEDNELNAEIAIAILEDMGFLVELAVDGVECVKKLSEAEAGYYDVILMDVQMPNLNGYDATRRIRSFEDAEKANTPIVAMTANAFEEDKRDALNAGMNGHLAKPIDTEEMKKVLAGLTK